MIPTKRTSDQLSDVEQDFRTPSRITREENVPSLVAAVYRKVWHEYDEWSKEDFASSMNSLISGAGTRDEVEDDIFEELEQLSLQETASTDTMPRPKIISLETPLEPTPLFNSCTPISSNQFTGDDSNHMPFIPLADDPSFDWKGHCEKYKDFEWQTTVFDSDLHAVVIETARRLYQAHGLSYSQIEETKILPLPLTSAEDGVLRTTRRQGALDWAGAQPDIRSKPPPSPSVSMRAEFDELVKQFCNSSSCMIGFCDQHIDWFPMPLPLPVQPHSSSSDLFQSIVTSCGNSCTILRVPGNMADIQETEWTPNEIDIFNILLAYAPDASPCDLAVICKKPCFEVYKRRMRLLPNQDIRSKPPERRLPALKSTMFNDLNCDDFHPNPPCRHEGPCDADADCACFQNKAHCERSCRCDLKICRRRWPGCNCVRSRSARPCGTDRCACFRAHRECDPELCGKCEARDQFNNNGCLNVSLQRGHRKATETKTGSWGLGLFLLEHAAPSELITEYVGELIYEPTATSRDDVSRHRQRNYLFDLNSALALDSEFAGNESRFINHSAKKFNCYAQVMMVHGNHRIGIYAHSHIEPGVELLLNYGTLFFQSALE
ncbi:hypothetical protein GYMLUDRAFT_89715 [Collybiopsis luxurians FD-317 M1]|nr:hypothetical protein GYMLUDRAFT_89715 [Collybiopsis luxurians FD-317 M1]